jgi:hypothetical protein
MSHINQCSYTNEDIGKGISFMSPVFPSLLPYFMIGMAALGVGGLVGALGAIYAINAALANGGRNDPIINYFIEARLANQAAIQNSQFFKPVYSREYFGSSDRAVVCISTDNIYWYHLEVPIFKASNSPTLTKNIYKYIKLYGDVLPGISNFNYSLIRNYIDLDLAPVVHVFKDNVDELSGLLSLDVNNKLLEGDLVLLTGQSEEQANGYYIIRPNLWDKVPNINSNYFLQQNSLGNLFSHNNLNNQKHILIDGIRAYNFFDLQETIEFQLKEGKAFAKVDDKSFIYTTSGIKTVLTLNIPITQEGTISKTLSNSNVIWLYKNDFTSVGPINNWMLEKTRREKGELLDPYNFSVAYGEGSFNSGSDRLDPETLYKVSFTDNEIRETNKLLNNQENDKIKLNQLTVWSGDISQIFSFTESDTKQDLLKAYSYTATQFLNRPFSTGDVIVAPTGNLNTLEIARLSNIIINDFSNNNFMELKSNKFKNTAIMSPTGDIYIENDLKNKSGSLVTTDDGLYWIHIDPEQECKLNDELSVKVLKETYVVAIPTASTDFGGIIPGDESHMVPLSSYLGTPNGIDESLDVIGTTYKYTVSEAAILKEKAKWPSSINWTDPETFQYGSLSDNGDSKKMSIGRLDSTKDMLLYIREHYLRPKGTNAKNVGKVKDFIDLSTTNTLYVKFRNIPRKIKGVDSEKFVRYVYDTKGGIGRSVMPAGSVGRIENNFTCWHCINSSGEYMTNIPAYYKLANEMRYRAFFGSDDGIENKNLDYLDSKNDWEWIPYEYYSAPCSIGLNENIISIRPGFPGNGGIDGVEYQGGIWSMSKNEVKEIVQVRKVIPNADAVHREIMPQFSRHDVERYTRIVSIQDDITPIAYLDHTSKYPEILCSKLNTYYSQTNTGIPIYDTDGSPIVSCVPHREAIFHSLEEIRSPPLYTRTRYTRACTDCPWVSQTLYWYEVSEVATFYIDSSGELPDYKFGSLSSTLDGHPILPATKNIYEWNGPNEYTLHTYNLTKRLTVMPPTKSTKLSANPLGTISLQGTAGAEGVVNPDDPYPFKTRVRIISDLACGTDASVCPSCESARKAVLYDSQDQVIDSSSVELNSSITIPEDMINATMVVTTNANAPINLTVSRVPCNA